MQSITDGCRRREARRFTTVLNSLYYCPLTGRVGELRRQHVPKRVGTFRQIDLDVQSEMRQ